jgi:membrane associated rhomboid family serine protease
MNGPPAVSFSFPKPGPALWSILIAMAVLGVFAAFVATWVPGGEAVFRALAFEARHSLWQPWRLLSSGLLTSPTQWSHLLFSLAGLYFLGAPLERRWGPWRFVRFFAVSIVLGNLVMMGVASAMPPDAQERFHPEIAFGPTAAITAVAVAWSIEFRDSTVNLFLFIPVRARTLFWVTLGFCVLDLVYPAGLPEGVVAPFGGIIAGLVLGGSPSLARTAWLRLRLVVLRRRAGAPSVEDLLGSRPKRRPRPGGPPLRIVSGGIDEALRKRNPPKDKRYLN